ncbi:MAG TPA: SAM-dependent chlorinase/fluorinase [Patescibacteria group bacterium]|nr:SAM-dependent chlorinase/fluorinase [Patescibacteria group bacterium]
MIHERQAIAPIHLVNDFNDDRSTVECEQEIRRVFRANHLLYEAPHSISNVLPFNVTDGAFKIFQLVNNLRRHRSPGIFIGVVDPGVGSSRRGVVVTTEENYTFVGPDNGLFTPALERLTITGAFQIHPDGFRESSATFHGRDQFSPIAAEIASGNRPERLKQLERIAAQTLIRKEFAEGQIVEMDGYPNVKIWQKTMGIPRNARGERAKSLTVTQPQPYRHRNLLWTRRLTIPVANCFEDVPDGSWLVYEGSSGREPGSINGLIEIAVRNRSGKYGAGNRLRARTGDVLGLSWQY